MKESQLSKDLFLLNAERIKYANMYVASNERMLSISKIKRIFKYIRKGSFRYIIDRFIQIARPTKEDEISLNDIEYSNHKIVVYMALFGKYDKIYEPLYHNAHIDYCVITDQDIPQDSIWKKIEPKVNLKNLNNRDKNRYFKILPHLFFPEYDYSIYIDSSYQIVTDLYPLVESLGTRIIGVHKFPSNSFYTQLNSIWSLNRASKKDVVEQINSYKSQNVPDDIGYYWNAVLVRKHNDPKCINVMDEWWAEYSNTTSKRDQVSLPYVLWKNQCGLNDIKSLGSDIYKNPRFYYRGHLYDDYKQ